MNELNRTNSQNPMRILMVAPQPWFQPRGTPFSVLHRIKAISLLGHKIDLVTYHIGENIAIENLTIHRAAKIPFIQQVRIGPSKSKILLDIALYFKATKLLKANAYDLLHTHEEASFFGIYLAKKYKIPHLYDMHSSLPQQLSNFKYSQSKLIKAVFEKLEKKTIKSAHAVITICPELQSYVQENFPDKTCVLIENAADNNMVFPPNPSDKDWLREEYNLNGHPLVLYYGTFEPYQGIDLLIESAEKIIRGSGRQMRFLIVGGNEAQIEKYRSEVKSKGLENHVQFTGFVRPQLIPALISLANVLVSPRLSGNNSPLKIYSYLRSGKPIVATRHITHTQILSDSVSVLAEPNPGDFAAGICKALDDKTLAQEIVDKAGKLAEEKYNYSSYLEKTQWILEQAVKVAN